jgi:hypothetical protein
METTFDYNDKRQKIIDRMNAGRLERGQAALTPRQEHLVREFVDDEGEPQEVELLGQLLASNSS